MQHFPALFLFSFFSLTLVCFNACHLNSRYTPTASSFSSFPSFSFPFLYIVLWPTAHSISAPRGALLSKICTPYFRRPRRERLKAEQRKENTRPTGNETASPLRSLFALLRFRAPLRNYATTILRVASACFLVSRLSTHVAESFKVLQNETNDLHDSSLDI